jgi:hypothetical protein
MHRVTEARDNVIITLDERPAYEVFAEAAGPLADDLRRALAFVFVGIPLDENPSRLERGRFLIRNIVGASEEHGVIAVAHHPQVGDAIGLVLRNAERAREDLKATLEQMADKATRPASFGLYFDCVSRGSGLYKIPGHDTAYIRQYLGAIPVAGFFTGFEIGPLGDATGLLQYSGVLALISEKKILTRRWVKNSSPSIRAGRAPLKSSTRSRSIIARASASRSGVVCAEANHRSTGFFSAPDSKRMISNPADAIALTNSLSGSARVCEVSRNVSKRL